MTTPQHKRKPVRYRVRQFNPHYFVAERKGWLFWGRITAEGYPYCPESYVSNAPVAAWTTQVGAEAAIKAAQALRDHPRTIWDCTLA